MNDLVMAVYRKDCYAGETTLHLVKVLASNDRLPAQYLSDEYELKEMCLVDCFNATKQKGEKKMEMTHFVIEYTTNLDDRKKMAMMATSKTEAYLRFVMASPKHYIIVDIWEIREEQI